MGTPLTPALPLTEALRLACAAYGLDPSRVTSAEWNSAVAIAGMTRWDPAQGKSVPTDDDPHWHLSFMTEDEWVGGGYQQNGGPYGHVMVFGDGRVE